VVERAVAAVQSSFDSPAGEPTMPRSLAIITAATVLGLASCGFQSIEEQQAQQQRQVDEAHAMVQSQLARTVANPNATCTQYKAVANPENSRGAGGR
jgi:uncharacterized lipoprotein